MGNRKDSAWTLLAAALALVAHLFIAGVVATPASASGLVICSGVGHRLVPDPDRSHDPARVPDCCLAGCWAAGSAALPRMPDLPAPTYGPSVATRVPTVPDNVVRHERSPINPRGPPPAA